MRARGVPITDVVLPSPRGDTTPPAPELPENRTRGYTVIGEDTLGRQGHTAQPSAKNRASAWRREATRGNASPVSEPSVRRSDRWDKEAACRFQTNCSTTTSPPSRAHLDPGSRSKCARVLNWLRPLIPFMARTSFRRPRSFLRLRRRVTIQHLPPRLFRFCRARAQTGVFHSA